MRTFFLLLCSFVCSLLPAQQMFFDDFDGGQVLGTGISNANWSGGTSGLLQGVTGTSYSYQGPQLSVTFSLTFDVAEGSSLNISDMSVRLRRSNTGAGASWSASVNGSPATFSPTAISTTSFSTHTSNTTFANLTGTVVIDFTFEGATPGTTCVNGSGPLTCGTIRLDNFQINGVLPITLTKFSVSQEDRACLLNWNTASEHNNAYFSIQRSADGTNFVEIGQLRGAGNSVVPNNYTFTDDQPLKNTNYYRLKQVDFDGSGIYSQVVSTTFGKAGNVQISPSPATAKIQLLFEEPIEEGTAYTIYDQLGRIATNGIFTAENREQEINLAALPMGCYIFQTVGSQSAIVKRFQKY